MYMSVQLFQHLCTEKTVLPLLSGLSFFMKSQLNVFVRIYFWIFYAVLLLCVSAFIITTDLSTNETSKFLQLQVLQLGGVIPPMLLLFLLLLQNCLDNSCSFAFPISKKKKNP